MADVSRIREGMSVIAADGQRIGFVSRVESSDKLRLTSLRDGQGFDHVIPLAWVSEVDRYVFLNRGSPFVGANWESAPTASPRPRPKAA